MENKICNCNGFKNFSYNYIYWHFLFHQVDLNYHLESIPFRLSISCKVGLLATDSLSLCLSGYTITLPSFLKDSLLDSWLTVIFFCFGLFLCHHFKHHPDHCLLASIVSDEKSSVNLNGIFQCIMTYFLLMFSWGFFGLIFPTVWL